jgi:hypothetical protein
MFGVRLDPALTVAGGALIGSINPGMPIIGKWHLPLKSAASSRIVPLKTIGTEDFRTADETATHATASTDAPANRSNNYFF